jgi:single-stranded-DNA-specific exonuclease
MAAPYPRKWQINLQAPQTGPLPDRLMAARGLADPAAAHRFLEPTLDRLHDPFLLDDMAPACDQIVQTLKRDLPILIHGDYDVDGITATALLTRFFSALGAQVAPMIPDRFGDGYGLTDAGVEAALTGAYGLVITVDCGIGSKEEVARLKAGGVPVIITDHHECPAELPDAVAVINPKRPGSRYPFASLAGVGVALKLMQALCRRLERGNLWQRHLDLVALGTVADVVPLLDENRCLVSAGLDQLNRRQLRQDGASDNLAEPTPGLLALARQAGQAGQPDRPITAQFLGFTAAPRINASGRLGDGADALALLLSDDPAWADQCARRLQDLNRQRQDIENELTHAAMQEIDSGFSFAETDFIIVANRDWHSGVIGIAASRLAEYYGRPAIVLSGDGKQYRGSCRSWGDIDILAALQAASDCLIRFGGHRKAAGLTLADSELERFRASIRAYAREHVHPEQLQAVIQADLEVRFADLTLENALAISRLEPFGEGNPQPQLVCRDLSVSEIKPVGNGRHLKLVLTDPAGMIDGIAFGLGDADDWLSAGDRIDLLFALDINEWQGRRSAQLLIRDIHLAASGNRFDDEPEAAEHHYTAHGSLRDLMRLFTQPLQALLPEAAEYKAVYQYLRTRLEGKTTLVDLVLLARKISRSYQMTVHPFRLARILSVFQETGLINRQSLGNNRFRLTVLPVTNRVRLEDSPTYRRLAAEREGG